MSDRAGAVLLWSGCLGFALGALFADWQVAVETGQVLAGLVHYPPDNPFFIYHVKLWTLLNQVSGLGLKLGLSEIVLSVIVSGVMGLLSFQALSLAVYALSRDALLAVGAAFVIFFSGATNHGVVYPLALLGTQETYGVIGLSWGVLSVALLAAGRPKAGGFMLGLAPAVHPSIGVWMGVLLGLTALVDWRGTWTANRAGRWWFLAGGGVSAISLAAQFAMMPALPHPGSAEATRYLVAFVSFWDSHRGPVNFSRGGIAINAGALAVSIIWLVRQNPPAPVRFLLRFIAVTACVSLALAAASHLPPAVVPTTLLVLMPSRLLNIDVMLGAALLLGLAGSPGSSDPGSVSRSRLLTLGIVACLCLSSQSWLWSLVDPGRSLVISVLCLAACALIAVATGQARATTAGLMAVVAGLCVLVGVERARAERASMLKDWTNEPIFRLAHDEPGLLLTGGDLHLIQLRTRRPVLLDGGGLDALPYALESGPSMNAILKDVYGLDLFHPPGGAGGGEVPPEFNRAIWEGYPQARWREIAQRYGVSGVLTPGSWRLDLPIAASGQDLTLYRIPR